MAPIFPLAIGAAALVSAALTYKTGKNAKAKFDKKRRKKLNTEA